ncbi:hypothetical protein Emin_0688 [Elusimicrobium minutum Pei191]|uniref:Uncharacterized protein n=1 Tax=Elusimicrobium minutum (strain Pei191) TaxID=445932 RepID=B2KCJ7_ELUMP|nr:hypothetical protein [Elusimicrobium minutum]ACC98243.1 hypothetical protein Emin_0688 [Elusimicrobium minutum Pei191]
MKNKEKLDILNQIDSIANESEHSHASYKETDLFSSDKRTKVYEKQAMQKNKIQKIILLVLLALFVVPLAIFILRLLQG